MIQIRFIPLQNVPCCICYQDYSRTFALCSEKESTECIGCIHLLNDQYFEFISSYSLEKLEVGCSILSCSFSDDNNVYYCVVTGYMAEEDGEVEDMEVEEHKGRILVFKVVNGQLELVAKKEISNIVKSLTPFNGKLLACLIGEIHLYTWMPDGDGTFGLQLEYRISEHGLGSYVKALGSFVKARGNLIVTQQHDVSFYDFHLEKGHIKVTCNSENFLLAFEILDDDLCLVADRHCNIFTVEKGNEDGIWRSGMWNCRVVGRFHLGYRVEHFTRGFLQQMPMPDSTVRQIPISIFGTSEGAIGVVASLPHDQFCFLQDLQSKLREFVKGMGDFSHEQFRSYFPKDLVVKGDKEMEDYDFRTFVDGDLIGLFLDLPSTKREEVAEAMAMSVEELVRRVKELEELKMLRSWRS